MLSSQYAPLFTVSNEWGCTNREQKSEFGSEMDRFTDNVSAALDSMSCGLELKITEQSPFDAVEASESADMSAIMKRLEKEPELVENLEELLQGWCESIESYLSEPPGTKRPTMKTKDAVQDARDVGPRGELDFWRGRMQRLNSITEQIQSDHCKQIVEILSKVSSTGSREKFGSRFPELIRRWKQIDVTVTESANEAKDNIKYLSSLQRFVEPFYDGTVGAMTDAIPALLNSVKVRLSSAKI